MTLDPDALVQRLWQRHAGVAASRVQVLEAAAPALAAGTASAQQRSDAVRAAHKLAGALGTYGRGGSEQARTLERLLESNADLIRVPDLVAALRRAVEDP